LGFYLRAITNTMMDIAIHQHGPRTGVRPWSSRASEESGGGQVGPGPVVGTSVRYFLGYSEMADLEREARRRATEEDRPFRWRHHLEAVLAHGTPPTPVIRDILFGET
jgi:hypothetical protein